MPDVLLIVGMATAVLFLAVVLIEGAIRSGYNPVYHTGSELELGERGWIQRANFFVVGLGMFAFAAGINQALDTLIGAVLLAIFGFGFVIAGVFAPDPVRGYPPGAPIEPRAEPSWRARIHYVSGPVAFLAVLGACLAVALQLDAFWQWYTLATAVAGLGMTLWTALAFQRDAANTGLVQRVLLFVYFTWIVLVGAHLLADRSL